MTNLTFSFTGRLIVITTISFLVVFLLSLFLAFEIGKKKGLALTGNNKEKIYVEEKANDTDNYDDSSKKSMR
jgi:hypothetical protein